MQGVGIFAPAGELALTAQQMFGTPAPSPVGIGKDQGSSINGLPRDAGAVGAGVGAAGIPSLTGGAAPSDTSTPSSLPRAGASSVVDPQHPAMWILVGALLLLGAIHLDIGGRAGVRVGK